jgi:hypothetical protein
VGNLQDRYIPTTLTFFKMPGDTVQVIFLRFNSSTLNWDTKTVKQTLGQIPLEYDYPLSYVTRAALTTPSSHNNLAGLGSVFMKLFGGGSSGSGG